MLGHALCIMPFIFGLIANNIAVSLLPVYLLLILGLMIVMHELLSKKAPIPKEMGNKNE